MSTLPTQHLNLTARCLVKILLEFSPNIGARCLVLILNMQTYTLANHYHRRYWHSNMQPAFISLNWVTLRFKISKLCFLWHVFSYSMYFIYDVVCRSLARKVQRWKGIYLMTNGYSVLLLPPLLMLLTCETAVMFYIVLEMLQYLTDSDCLNKKLNSSLVKLP